MNGLPEGGDVSRSDTLFRIEGQWIEGRLRARLTLERMGLTRTEAGEYLDLLIQEREAIQWT